MNSAESSNSEGEAGAGGSGDRRDRSAPLLLAAGAAAFLFVFFPPLFGGETFFLRDLASFHRPLARLLVRLGAEGTGSLLWNPYLADGQPFAANPNALVHHPLALLFAILPFEWAFRLLVLLPIVAAGAAMFVLLRSLGRDRPAAILGASAWALSGLLLSTTNLLPTLLALAPIPAVAGFARNVVRREGRWSPLGLSLSLGLLLLAGEPAMILGTPLVVLAALLVSDGKGGRSTLRQRGPRAFLRLLLPALFALLVGAATLLPAAGLVRRSVRAEAGGLAAGEAAAWSFPPIRIAELLHPNALGHADRDRLEPGWYWGGSLYPGKGAPYLVSIYPGLLGLLLAAVAIRRRAREELPWLILSVAAFIVAAGENTPLFGAIRLLVPPLASLRHPERFAAIALLALLPPMARGFELTIDDEYSRRSLRRFLFAIAIPFGVVAAALFLAPLLFGPDCWARWGLVPERLAAAVARQLPIDPLRPALIAAAALAALRFSGGGKRGALSPLLGLVLLAELALAGRALVPTRPVEEVAAPPPVLAPLAASPFERTLFDEASLDPRRGWVGRIAIPPEPSCWAIPTTLDPDVDRTQLAATSRGNERVIAAMRSDPSLVAPLLARRGAVARLGIRGEPGSPDDPPRLELLRLHDHRPALFFPDVVRTIGEEGEWEGAVAALGPDAARGAVIERGEIADLPAPPSGVGRVERFELVPGRISAKLRVEGNAPALLAVNQSWDRGWQARLDGTLPLAIRRTDLSLIALAIPPGPHDLSLEYGDPLERVGQGMALVGLLGCAGLLLAAIRAKRESTGDRPAAG
jgi:hypothetical protein